MTGILVSLHQHSTRFSDFCLDKWLRERLKVNCFKTVEHFTE